MGSMSPSMSAIVTSGVASFSTNRAGRGSYAIGMSSPSRAMRARHAEHSGASAIADENTMVAFANRLSLGADGSELDVHLSSDGVVVVHHDATVDRTTTGRGSVASLTAGELARLNVPSLADVLKQFRDTRVVVELKVNSKQLGRGVVEVVRQADAVERVCL